MAARAGRVAASAAWTLAIAAHVLLLLAPLLFSRDVYSYAAYGRIAAVLEIFADVLAPYGFNQISPVNRLNPPSAKFWLGRIGTAPTRLSRAACLNGSRCFKQPGAPAEQC